jgi:DNA-binding PucR family transcriptional regulator
VPDPRPAPRRLSTGKRLERARGRLATDAMGRMDAYPWFRALDAAERSWVGVIAQAGINAFVDWYAHPDSQPHPGSDVFGNAPRELVRAITLRQTVELVRTTIDVVEEQVDRLAAPGDEAALREAVLRYGREIAFASAQIYAQAAEARGAWDARLEALVVDALLRGEVDEAVRSRAAALGWHSVGGVAVVVGAAPDGDPEAVVEAVQRSARQSRLDVLAGVQGDRLVAVLGRVDDEVAAAAAVVDQFGDGPVVVGPRVQDLLLATTSAQAAIAGLSAANAWPSAPRPVAADGLLPERALAGDPAARQALAESIAAPLTGPVRATVEAFLESGSLEGAARALFVHPNTVRYRLRRATELTGQPLTTARGAYVVRTALAVERLLGGEPRPGRAIL